MTRLSLPAAALLASLTFCLPGIASATDDATFVGLGGKQGIKKIVNDLIPLIQADDRIKELDSS